MPLFGPRAPQDRDLKLRIAELEDDVQALERRFESLRGSVTGGLRRLRRAADLELQDDEEPEELNFDDHALGARRRFKLEG